ncbi:MAG: hypothetical protein IH870_10145 [Chloroflexi bacterium]|nr:hypothetical protein [Chloroflexota bacterium]
MESWLRIQLVQENLALAISLWAAARRGFITAAFIPGRSEILTGSGQIVEVSTPLQLGDNTNLVRCVNNQIRGNFALSAINTHLVLSSVYANSPLEEAEPDLRAARCSLYLLHHTLSHDMMTPVWQCPVKYRQRFEVSSIGFVLDATHLDGKEVFWDDFGGLPKYLDLLEYCKQRVAAFPESPSSAYPMPQKPRPETFPATPDPVAAIRSAPTGPAAAGPFAPAPVLAGATVAAGSIPAAPFGTQQPLPIGESLPIGEPLPQYSDSGLDPAPLPGPASDSAAAFVSTRGVVATQAMILAKELYDDYLSWCRETGREPLSQRSFGMRLTGLGFERKRRARGRHWWIGLGLAEP